MKYRPLQISLAVFFSRKRSGFFFGMMEWFRILFRVLRSSSLCVAYVFFRGFAYVLRCCLRFCFLPFALGLCASVRVRVRVRVRVCVCVWCVFVC